MLFKAKPELAVKLIKIFSHRINDSIHQLRNLSIMNYNIRIMDMLTYMIDKNIKEQGVEEGGLSLDVTPDDLSNIVGLKVANCNNSLNELANKKLISISDSKIVVRDPNEFKRAFTLIMKREKFKDQS